MCIAAAIAGTAVLGAAGSIYSSDKQRSSANKAADAQTAASNAQIQQQKDQFDQIQKLLAPYAAAGTGALSAQQNLVGLNGNDAQSQAIAALQASPAYTSMLASGNQNILANASATGGLRGGNTQAALAQFSPALLAQTINDQYNKLGGLTSIGQNAAAGTGNALMGTGNNITQLLGQQGQIAAGQQLADGRASIGLVNGITQSIGAGLGAYNGFGGTSNTMPLAAPAWSAGASSPFGFYATPPAVTNGPSFSDARLKKNIRRIGKTARGHDLHSWDWKDGSGSGSGVIAQQVAGVAGAVVEDPRSGFLKVDYRKV